MATGRLRDSNRDNAGDFIGECSVTQSCEPCMKTNVSTTATVFCKDCYEYLCDACKNPHIVYKAGKHDIVNSQDRKSLPMGVDMKGMDMCPEHDKEIECLCKDHSKLCCSKCVLIHRKCDQLDEIASVIGPIRHEIQAFNQSLINLQSEADAIIAHCKYSESGLNESIEKISSEVDAMRDRIIQLFEGAKQKLMNEAKQFKTSEVKRIGIMRDASSNVKEEIHKEVSMCCAILQRGTPTQKYIYSTKIKGKLNTIESKLIKQHSIKISSTMTVSFPIQVTALLDMGDNVINLSCDGNTTAPMGGSRSRKHYNNRTENKQPDFPTRATPNKPIVTSNDYNFAILTAKLEDYSRIMGKLFGDSDLQVGMVTKLMITHVENEKFFWAQRLEDNVNGANGNLPKLQELSLRLQKPDQKQGPINSLGRCTAQFEGYWYRAWCIAETTRNGIEMSDVFFFDYGNKALVPKCEVLCVQGYCWTVPPMAAPFKLSAPDLKLPSMVNQVVTVQVVEAGKHTSNFVSTVKWSSAVDK